MAVSDEKASSDLENSLVKDKLNNSLVEEDFKSDAVLDEIAAKVDALDFSKADEDDNIHTKYIETVKKQGETINTLVQQLRIMFDEYQEINQEREYYEELNDALIRCLEITEGRLQLDESDDSEGKEENITYLVSKESEEICISQEKEESAKENNSIVEESKEINSIAEEGKENTDKQNESIEINIENKGDEVEQENEATPTEKRTISNSELIRLNRILLREIFELRHQIEVMKENIREYLYSDEGESEYDTATDDDHVCEHCSGAVAATKTEEHTEEYEETEDENLNKIKDESDTE